MSQTLSSRIRFQTLAAWAAVWMVGLTPHAADAQSGAVSVPAAERADIESPIVPVHHEPHHRQVFQYGPTRILDLQIPPGDMSWFHTHEWPVLYMTLSRSAIRAQNLGSDWSGGGARADRNERQPATPRPPPRATSSTGYIDTPSTHRIENIGDSLFRAMVVVNETAGNDQASVEQAGFGGEPELSNAWFRSYRVSLAPGESTGEHEHTTPVVIFQAIDGKGKAHGAMDFEFNEPGQWAFYDRGGRHSIENLGTGPLELLEIEVRLPD